MLGIPGEEEYHSRGSTTAQLAMVHFTKTDELRSLVETANSAVQEAIFLTRFAAHVDLLVRSKLRASEVLQEKLYP